MPTGISANPCPVVNIAAVVEIAATATPSQRPGHLVTAHTVRTAQNEAEKYWNEAIPHVQISNVTGQQSSSDATIARGATKARPRSLRLLASIFHIKSSEPRLNPKPRYISSTRFS